MSQFRPSTTAILAGGAIAILVAGGGAAWWALHNLSRTTDRPVPTAIEPAPIPIREAPKPVTPDSPKPVVPDSSKTVADIYWLDPKSDRLVLQAEPIAVNKASDRASVLTAALNQLLVSSDTHPEKTTIPANTKLLGLKVADDGIHLNLSATFSEGGGSTAMVGRLGQVLYTATSLDRDAPVWIDINGQPLEVLGGEGIEVPQPITRKYFQENFQG